MIFLAFHVTSSEIWRFLWIAHLSIAWKKSELGWEKTINPKIEDKKRLQKPKLPDTFTALDAQSDGLLRGSRHHVGWVPKFATRAHPNLLWLCDSTWLPFYLRSRVIATTWVKIILGGFPSLNHYRLLRYFPSKSHLAREHGKCDWVLLVLAFRRIMEQAWTPPNGFK